VARSVDQVELVGLAVSRQIFEHRRLRLDGDAALALEIHRIENLGLHLAVRQASTQLDDAIGQGGFPVVDMGDD